MKFCPLNISGFLYVLIIAYLCIFCCYFVAQVNIFLYLCNVTNKKRSIQND